MNNLIEIRGLCKRYADFSLQNINLSLPAGCIMGLIGENGAGKTTTIRAILNVVRPDSGTIRLMGKSPAQAKARAQVAVVFEDSYFYGTLTPLQISHIMQGICPVWDADYFAATCRRFDLNMKKPIKDFSRGMRMKMSLISALARRPRLLILDEATSGLDPVVRGEMLDLFLDFMQDEQRGILFSSHITSDLEQIADQIAYIHHGQLLFQKNKDELMEDMAIVRCSKEQLDTIPERLILSRQSGSFSHAALVRHPHEVRRILPNVVMDKASIDEMMQFYAGRDSQ